MKKGTLKKLKPFLAAKRSSTSALVSLSVRPSVRLSVRLK